MDTATSLEFIRLFCFLFDVNEEVFVSKTLLLLRIDRPYLTIEVYKDWLRIDLKGNAINEAERALENKRVLRETIGAVLSLFVPLHIRIKDIESVTSDSRGRVTIKPHLHRALSIPLEQSDAKTLTDKLRELLEQAKEEKAEQVMEKHRVDTQEHEEHVIEGGMIQGGYTGFITEPLGTLTEEERAEREIVREHQEHEED